MNWLVASGGGLGVRGGVSGGGRGLATYESMGSVSSARLRPVRVRGGAAAAREEGGGARC